MAVPHGVGSVWAQAAWKMYWALVDAHGFDANLMNGSGTAGNQRAMLYVNEGLMNTACSSTFTDVRDGIIQAAADNHGGADVCLLWSTFASFGLGTDAVSGGASSTSPTNGSALPVACLANVPTISVNDVSIIEGTAPALATSITAGFTLTLSAPSAETVRVGYATADGTAIGTGLAANTTSMALPSSGTNGTANPYPSTITVPATVPAVQLTDVNVTLTGFSHTYPADIDILLEGPSGATVVLMSDVGSFTNAVNATLTFDDAGVSMGGPVTSGTYRPTNIAGGDVFASPAPSGTPGTDLAVFNGTNPAGTWKLYIVDDFPGDSGSLSGGWSLDITSPIVSNPTSIALPGTGTDGPVTPYPSEITVPGAGAVLQLTDVDVTLTGFTHTYPADIDVLLEGPTGATVTLMSDVGSSTDVANLTLTIDDASPSMTAPLTSGTYRPTNGGGGDAFPSPAPGGTPGSALRCSTGRIRPGPGSCLSWTMPPETSAVFREGGR